MNQSFQAVQIPIQVAIIDADAPEFEKIIIRGKEYETAPKPNFGYHEFGGEMYLLILLKEVPQKKKRVKK